MCVNATDAPERTDEHSHAGDDQSSLFALVGWKVFRVLRVVTPSTYYRRIVERRLTFVRAVESYVLLTLLLMFAAAALAGRYRGLDIVLVIYAVGRLAEIGQVALGSILEADGHRTTAEMGGGRQHFPRSTFLIIALIYLVQVVLAFAVLDHALSAQGFHDPTRSGTPESEGDFVYLSATTMFPFAGYTAATGLARALTILEVGCSFIGITLLIGIAVGQFDALPAVQRARKSDTQ
jgi:hypothetical protein